MILIVATLTPLLVSVTAVNPNRPNAASAVSTAVEPRLVPAGHPLPNFTKEWSTWVNWSGSTPAIADVDGDGHQEVVVGSVEGRPDGYLYCLSSTGGIKWRAPAGTPEYGCPVIADVDNDGKLEIVVGGWYTGKVYCFSGTGGLKWSSPSLGMVGVFPVVADIDGDGKQEVVVGASSHTSSHGLYCLNSTGGIKWSYSTGVDFNSAAVADLDGDGHLEVLATTWYDNLACLNSTGGIKWTALAGRLIDCPPVVADINGDGKFEILVGTWDSALYCLNRTGGVLWSFPTIAPIRACLVTDLNGDGQLEVIFGSLDHNIYCLNKTGGMKWKVNTGNTHCCPAVADMNGDGKKEVIVSSSFTSGPMDYNYTYCLNENGTVEWGYSMKNSAEANSPAVVDIDGDNQLEAIIGPFDGNVYCLSIPSAPFNSSKYAWPSISVGGDVRHNSLYVDSDKDGLTNGYEATAGTKPNSNDTDGDGYTDYQEWLVSSNPLVDDLAPAALTDLAVSSVTESSVTLTWTAPGAIGHNGNASGYIVRYSTSGPILDWSTWDVATTYSQSWTPARNGTTETRQVTGLTTNTTYWFAVRAYTGAHYGAASNSPSATTTTPTGGGTETLAIIAAVAVGVVVVVGVAIYFLKKK